ncbi:hypothetical protein A2U01_0096671, partial [Trifolium medium]|nr:hypothetical protein [Trifolium medium]
TDTISPARVRVEYPVNLSLGPQGVSEDRALRTSDSSQMSDAQERPNTRKADEESGRGVNNPLYSKRSSSCPPEASRSV